MHSIATEINHAIVKLHCTAALICVLILASQFAQIGVVKLVLVMERSRDMRPRRKVKNNIKQWKTRKIKQKEKRQNKGSKQV